MTSDKQTLIPAGAPSPRRGMVTSGQTSATAGSQLQRLNIIATRSDDTTAFLQGEYETAAASRANWRSATNLVSSNAIEPPLLPARSVVSDLPVPLSLSVPSGLPASSNRGPASGVTQYARTRDLPYAGTRAEPDRYLRVRRRRGAVI